MEAYNYFVFQDNATTTNTGQNLSIIKGNQVTIYITGTSINHTLTFDGCDSEGNWFNATAIGAKLPSINLASSTTGINEVWVIDTSYWASIRINITSISDGYIRVVGKVVAV